MNTFYENYKFTLKNVELEDESENKFFNKLIEFVKNNEKEELNLQLSNLKEWLKFEYSHDFVI